jgi:hypothetical protein
MNAIRTPLILATAACLFALAAHANDIEPGKEFYTAIKAPNPIVLDGDLSEWSGAALLADPRFSIPKGSGDDGELVFFEEYNGGVWTGPDDHTSAVQIVYDDDNVYFGFIVTDEYHENSANSAWNGDSVQLMVANEARDTQVALYNYALGGIESELGENPPRTPDVPATRKRSLSAIPRRSARSTRSNCPRHRSALKPSPAACGSDSAWPSTMVTKTLPGRRAGAVSAPTRSCSARRRRKPR